MSRYPWAGVLIGLAAGPVLAAPAKPAPPPAATPAAAAVARPAVRPAARPVAKGAAKPAAKPAPPVAALASRLTEVAIRTLEPVETDGYVRITGTVTGVVDPKEPVVGLGDLPRTADGQYQYVSEFELVVPAAGRPANEVAYLDAENRGTPIGWRNLGAGFLPSHATSYARVQWQTGVSKGVPATAQGVGLVIVRDFARWLAGRTPETQVGGPLPGAVKYPKLILGGVSQSAWLVDTLIAEGFNVDPKTSQRVFDAAIAIDGVGQWLAINQIAAKRGLTSQSPYLDPNGLPLSRTELLSRPATDPLYVDVAN